MASQALVSLSLAGVVRRRELIGAIGALPFTTLLIPYECQQDLGQQQGCGPQPPKQCPPREAYWRLGRASAGATVIYGGKALPWPLQSSGSAEGTGVGSALQSGGNKPY